MERVEQIMKHPLYQRYQKRIEELEQDRIFCTHDRGHSLDVARIMYILILERRVSVTKDVVYAAALLHDIGRAVQYEDNRPHHEAGAEFAAVVLKDCGYETEEIRIITQAIACHAFNQTEDDMDKERTFQKLLYEADKLSRSCFDCEAHDACYWKPERKNERITY